MTIEKESREISLDRKKLGVECPQCGNHVEFDPGRKKAICPECNKSFNPYYWEEEE